MKAVCNKKDCVLALGAESEGIFAVYNNGNIFISDNFGDLLEESNFLKYKKAVLCCLKRYEKKLEVIVTDLHPLYKTTIFGEELAKKYKARHIKVQHHIAHIFSAAGDKFCHPELVSGSINNGFQNKFEMTNSGNLSNTFYGIAMDGTGYGSDGNIWGGEAFQIKNVNIKMKNDRLKCKIDKIKNLEITRVGSLEEQIMIGGDLAVREPARVLISILSKFLAKEKVYKYAQKYYSKNEFEALYNQLKQGFNCQKTTSAGRILDAVAVLLGFAGNERNYKHEATKLLERNSIKPYNVKPITMQEKISADEFKIKKSKCKMTMKNSKFILQTTLLFEYLIKNIHKDKRRLAATAQLYIAKGLYQIVKNNSNTKYQIPNTIFAAGGITNNKIISAYLEKHGVCLSKKIPRGDEGMAAGQIVYYLLNKMGI